MKKTILLKGLPCCIDKATLFNQSKSGSVNHCNQEVASITQSILSTCKNIKITK
jgi:hypothetical protein